MSTLRENVETFLNLSRGLKAAIAVAEEVQSVEKIEQMIGEANARLRAKQDEEASIDASLSAAKAKLSTETAKAKKAEAKASEILADAEAKLAITIKQAKGTAADIERQAKDGATEIRAAADRAKSEADGYVREKQDELAKMNEQIALAADEFVALSGKIEEARATIKQMIGG